MDYFSALEYVKRYLNQAVAHAVVSETEKFVLDFGQAYVGTRRPRGFRLGERKQCFYNAAEAICTRRDESLSYVEGYAMVPGLPPIHHAWIALDNQHAVELTVKNDPLEMAFFGVPFSSSELMDLLEKKQTYGLLSFPIHASVFDLVQRRILTLKSALS
jgi:hypothetical protein